METWYHVGLIHFGGLQDSCERIFSRSLFALFLRVLLSSTKRAEAVVGIIRKTVLFSSCDTNKTLLSANGVA